jgi:Asp-tRNA(Asn)/Glu-tRNA(Gln) amidotransferase A subunit family amidase
MSSDLSTASATMIAAAVRSGTVTAREVTETALARITATHAELNAFNPVTAERARREADAVDAAMAAGHDPGPLAGATYEVKNLFELAGEATLAGAKINRGAPPPSPKPPPWPASKLPVRSASVRST